MSRLLACLIVSGVCALSAVDLAEVMRRDSSTLAVATIAFPVLPNQYNQDNEGTTYDPTMAFDLYFQTGPHSQLFTDIETGSTLESSFGASFGYASFDDIDESTLLLPGVRYQIGFGNRLTNNLEIVGSAAVGLGYAFALRPKNSRSTLTAPSAEWAFNLDVFWIRDTIRFGVGIGHQARRSYPRNHFTNDFLTQDYMTGRLSFGWWY